MPASFASMQFESDSRPNGNPLRFFQLGKCSSASLRRLRQIGLLEKHGNGSVTHYAASQKMLAELGETDSLHDTLHDSLHDKRGLKDKLREDEGSLPTDLKRRLIHTRLGKRSSTDEVIALIIDICRHGTFSKDQIAAMIGRDPPYVAQHYISPLVKDGRLEMTNPEMPSHPEQKYRSSK